MCRGCEGKHSILLGFYFALQLGFQCLNQFVCYFVGIDCGDGTGYVLVCRWYSSSRLIMDAFEFVSNDYVSRIGRAIRQLIDGNVRVSCFMSSMRA